MERRTAPKWPDRHGTGRGYNATLAPGGAVDIGFTATYRTNHVVPHGFPVNGTVCAAA
ncbi:cellulose binding domain-containing protein [Streptomyces sp. NPDC008079]|uniref:cellulose binding domain-containing protein n=1 Tax=unclassified Streptomyces TaxID=2593676 RepID=UPI0036E98276